MPNASLTYGAQDLGTGDTRALALKMHSGTVMAVYNANTPLIQMVNQKTITEGKSHQFPVIGRTSGGEHEPGTERTGQTKPLTEERTVPVDSQEIETSNWVPTIDDNVRHYDVYGPYSMQQGAFIADYRESRAARMVCLGARQAATGTDSDFDSGVLVQRNAADVETGYPVSSLGSRNLQHDLGEAMQGLQERRINKSTTGGFTPTAFISSYLGRVLLQDNSLSSADYLVDRSTNSKIKMIVNEVEGWRVVITQNMPQYASAAGLPGYAIGGTSGNVSSGESAYQGNFSETAWFGVGSPTALGVLNFGGVRTSGPSFYETKLATFLGASHHGGIKWVQREACVECYCATNAYGLSGGVYDPDVAP